MRDSYISARVPKDATDEEVQSKLTQLFEEAFKKEFGSDLWHVADIDIVSGLERGGSEADNKIVFRYKHGDAHSSARELTKQEAIEAVELNREQRAEFFRRLGR